MTLATLAGAALWLIAARLIPSLRERHRGAAFWALVLTGVPMLGWVTLNFGPGAGVLGFALAVAALALGPRHPDYG